MFEKAPAGESRPAKRLTDEQLKEIESALLDLRHTLAAGDFFEADRILQRSTLDASSVRSLVSEVLRLRTLVAEVAPHFERLGTESHGDKEARMIRQLQARLNAEVD